MKKILPVLAALLLVAGCGGDAEQPSSAPSDDITVAEFIAELRPAKQQILEAFVAGSQACKGLDVDSGFVLLISARAIDAAPEGPLSDLVEEQC